MEQNIEQARKNSPRLREERLYRHWSQRDLADKLGTTRVTISRWEAGVTLPSAYFRQKLTQLFDKDIDELLFARNTEHVSKQQDDETLQDQLVYANVAEEVSTEAPSLTLPVREPQSMGEEQVFSPRQRGFSRRKMVLGLLGGVGAISIGGFWWFNISGRSEPSLASASTPTSTATVLYAYKPDGLFSVNYVTWSPHGTFLACAIGDKTAQVLKAVTGDIEMVYREHTGYIDCVTWAPDESRVASASADKTVQVWKTTTGENVLTYRGHTAGVHVATWSHKGTLLASGGTDKTVQVWDAFSGKRIQTYKGHTQPVWNVEWSPDDESIASGGEDGTIRVWNPMTALPSKMFVYEGPKSRINEISWSPNGKQIASAHIDGTVRLWDASTGAAQLTYQGHTSSVLTARWSPDGHLIASGDLDGSVRLWNAASQETLVTYKKQTKAVYEISWSPDGKKLASAAEDATMYVCAFHLS